MGRTLDPSRLGDHIDRLYRAACALTGSRIAADDLVQDTYAKVLAKPRLLRNDDDVGYLLRTMRNLFYDERRQAARRATDPVDPEDFERDRGAARGRTRSPSGASCWRPSPRCRRSSATCSSRSTSPGCPTRRPPSSLGAPEGTVMSRLYRARKRVIEAYG